MPTLTMPTLRPADPHAQRRHFEALYAADDDPWQVRASWYEQRKRALLLASLHRQRYRHAFEPGCGNGELSAALAQRCERLLAVDGAASAVAAARRRLRHLPGCRVEQASLPDDWPTAQQFDLIVISELAYYFDAPALRAMAASALASLAPGALLLLCHWRHDFDDRVSATDAVHAIFGAAADGKTSLAPALRHEEDDFLLQGWTCAGARP